MLGVKTGTGAFLYIQLILLPWQRGYNEMAEPLPEPKGWKSWLPERKDWKSWLPEPKLWKSWLPKPKAWKSWTPEPKGRRSWMSQKTLPNQGVVKRDWVATGRIDFATRLNGDTSAPTFAHVSGGDRGMNEGNAVRLRVCCARRERPCGSRATNQ